LETHGRAGVAIGWLEGVGSVLDLGCSEGLFAHLASSRGWKVVGIDVDDLSVSAAKRQAPEADFALGSGESLPFLSETFDRVIMLDVLEHVPSEVLAMREVDRVLKNGGRLIISVPHKGTFDFIDAQNSLIFATGRKIIKGKDSGQHHKHYSIEELQGLLGSSFDLTRCRYGGYLLFPVLGYALMFTDALRLWRLSASLRRVEQVDFDRDRGDRSWHLMAEFTKR
jgi:SAM-dependent methyltransferase